jgi:hypothetical protein
MNIYSPRDPRYAAQLFARYLREAPTVAHQSVRAAELPVVHEDAGANYPAFLRAIATNSAGIANYGKKREDTND